MGLTRTKCANNIRLVIRVQKLSMPGTGGEPAGSPFIFREERRCPKNSSPTSSRWRSSEAPASESRTKRYAFMSQHKRNDEFTDATIQPYPPKEPNAESLPRRPWSQSTTNAIKTMLAEKAPSIALIGGVSNTKRYLFCRRTWSKGGGRMRLIMGIVIAIP